VQPGMLPACALDLQRYVCFFCAAELHPGSSSNAPARICPPAIMAVHCFLNQEGVVKKSSNISSAQKSSYGKGLMRLPHEDRRPDGRAVEIS
jgi:hypothetical protein